jgi:hypothetical protein
VPNLVVPGHVVSEIRRVRFSGFPFEWDMAYNNLPCTNVQAVILNILSFLRIYHTIITNRIFSQLRSFCTLARE